MAVRDREEISLARLIEIKHDLLELDTASASIDPLPNRETSFIRSHLMIWFLRSHLSITIIDDPMRSTRVFYLEFPLLQLVFFPRGFSECREARDQDNGRSSGLKCARRSIELSVASRAINRGCTGEFASASYVSRRGSRENLLHADRYPRCARFVAIGDSFALLFMERLILCMIFRFVEAFVEYRFGTRCNSSRWGPSILARPPDAFPSRVFFFHGIGFRFVDYEDICASIPEFFKNNCTSRVAPSAPQIMSRTTRSSMIRW